MIITPTNFAIAADSYLQRLNNCFQPNIIAAIETLAQDLHQAWIE